MSNVTFSPPNIYPNSNMNTFSQTGQGGIGVRAPDYLNEMNLETGQYFTGTNVPYPTTISKENNPHVYSPEEKTTIGAQESDMNSSQSGLMDEEDKKLLTLFDMLGRNSSGGGGGPISSSFTPGSAGSVDMAGNFQAGQQIGASLGFSGLFGGG